MGPHREEFFLDVRTAARLEQRPIVTTDSELVNHVAVSRALQRAALWLTPKVVEKYDPNDFSTFPADLQAGLSQAIGDFRSVAASVPPDKPATNDQFVQGLDAFRRMTLAIQKTVLSEWQIAVEDLISRTEKWSTEFEWRDAPGEERTDRDAAGLLLPSATPDLCGAAPLMCSIPSRASPMGRWDPLICQSSPHSS